MYVLIGVLASALFVAGMYSPSEFGGGVVAMLGVVVFGFGVIMELLHA